MAVILNSGGLWPKWLGGYYVSDEGCTCQDYNPQNGERSFHWLICPIKSAWGLKDTGMLSTAIIHYDTSCASHGHGDKSLQYGEGSNIIRTKMKGK